MALNNKDIQALFDRKTSSADILAAKDVKEERELNSWGDMFTDLFELNVEGKNILATPKNTTVLVQRNLPPISPANIWGIEVRLPVMFSFDDSNKNRWWGYVYDFYSKDGWKFILFKPDRLTVLEYLKGNLELQDLYDTADNIYLVTPNIDSKLIEVEFDSLPDTAKPLEGSVYNTNIWLDVDDLLFGMNMIDVARVRDLANNNKFYL